MTKFEISKEQWFALNAKTALYETALAALLRSHPNAREVHAESRKLCDQLRDEYGPDSIEHKSAVSAVNYLFPRSAQGA